MLKDNPVEDYGLAIAQPLCGSFTSDAAWYGVNSIQAPNPGRAGVTTHYSHHFAKGYHSGVVLTRA